MGSTWSLDAAYPVTPETTDLHLLVEQYGASYGQPISTELPTPFVSYSQDSIRIDIPVRWVYQAVADTEPTFPLVVHLDQPVGSRSITPGNAVPLLIGV